MNHENHSSSLDLLALQDQEVVKNTFYRYPKVSPHTTLYEDHLEVKTIDESVDLYKLDEVVLYILSTYKWIPLWLIQQWFEDYNKDGFLYASKWIKVGLVWAETTALGVFIRPTKYLLDLMIDEPDKAKEIISVLEKYNLLYKTQIEMDDETTTVYNFNPTPSFIAFLIFAREMIKKPDNFSYYSGGRNKPYLK